MTGHYQLFILQVLQEDEKCREEFNNSNEMNKNRSYSNKYFETHHISAIVMERNNNFDKILKAYTI